MGDADYIYAFQQVIMPIAYEFAPDIVLGELVEALASRLASDIFLCSLRWLRRRRGR